MNETPSQRPWILHQTWSKLLFAHWPLPPSVLRPFIPAALDVDTFEGQAWIGVVPFYMSGIHFRGLPPFPTTGEFCELNVRTYVTLNGEHSGVWFFSLDAGSALVVLATRLGFHLPYFHAQMRMLTTPESIHYASYRTHRGAPEATFLGNYHPVSPVFHAEPDSLEHWLTERYALYTADRAGHIYRGDIEHPQWSLQTAELEIQTNIMTLASGITLPDVPPLLHYSERQEVKTWYLQRVR